MNPPPRDDCTKTLLFHQGCNTDNIPNTKLQLLKAKMPADTLLWLSLSHVCMFPLPEKQYATYPAGQPWSNPRKPNFQTPSSQQDLYIALLCQNFTVNTVIVILVKEDFIHLRLWDFNSKSNTCELISNVCAMKTYVKLLWFSFGTLYI